MDSTLTSVRELSRWEEKEGGGKAALTPPTYIVLLYNYLVLLMVLPIKSQQPYAGRKHSTCVKKVTEYEA